MGIGKNIRAIAAYRGITSLELAEKTGVSRVSISKFLNEKMCPKTLTLKKIADALGVTVDFILTYEIKED